MCMSEDQSTQLVAHLAVNAYTGDINASYSSSTLLNAMLVSF